MYDLEASPAFSISNSTTQIWLRSWQKRQQARSNRVKQFCDLPENMIATHALRISIKQLTESGPKVLIWIHGWWLTNNIKNTSGPYYKGVVNWIYWSTMVNQYILYMVMEMYRPTHTDERTFQEGPHTCDQANGPGLILEKYLINLLS